MYVVIYIKKHLIFASGSWHPAPKTLGISKVINVFLSANEMSDGWEFLDGLGREAGCQGN